MTTPDSGVGVWIERRARTNGDDVALVSGDVVLTYADLTRRIRRLAHALRSLGVEHGDRVGYLGANHPAFLEGLFAAGTIGAILTPINHRLEPEQIDGICRDAAPRVVLQDRALAGRPLPPEVDTTVTFGEPGDDGSELERLLADADPSPIRSEVGPEDVCMLPYTSGTTGPPKGIMLTHGNVTWNVFNMLSFADFRADDVTLAIAPFFRTGGTGVNVLPVLWKGGTVVIPRRMDPEEILRLAAAHRVTVGFGNPALLERLATSPAWSTADLSSLRMFVTGGAPVYESLLEAYGERGVPFLQGYGLSEAAPVVSLLDAGHAARKLGSAGRPPLHVEVRVVHPDGSECGPDELGELLVRGPNVMAGYWQNPEATARALDGGGWLHTGDAVRADAEGFLYVLGRVADGYAWKGQWVHPGPAEHFLIAQPTVAEACVVRRDDEVIAYLVPREGSTLDEAAILAACRVGLPAVAVPTRLRLLDVLPRNPGGKVMRHRLP